MRVNLSIKYLFLKLGQNRIDGTLSHNSKWPTPISTNTTIIIIIIIIIIKITTLRWIT